MPQPLSPDQRAAVERTGQNVCVIAGPGSGKTRVLIERFAWLVEHQSVDAGRILAITFTEKAATEIKQRLVDRFAHRTDLRESIERAWVATIDGFCTRVLREHAIEAGLSPDFAVLEEGAADLMRRAAAEASLDELFEERPHEMRRLLEALDLSTMDDGPQPDLAASLIEVYETMVVSGASEIPAARPAADLFARTKEVASAILRDATVANTANQRAAIPVLRDWASKFRTLPDSPISRAHFEALATFDVNLAHLVKGSPAREAATLLKRELVDQLESNWLQEWYADLHDLLRTAVTRIGTLYAARKREEAVVDFGDLEALTVRLLESNQSIRKAVSGRFDQILMDELQDTNPLQWKLLKLISKGVFFGVGDINQSIYGFRHADPGLFREYRDSLERTSSRVDQLNENYRSRKQILDTVSLMLDQAPGIEPRAFVPQREFAPARVPVVTRLVGQGDDAPEIEAALVAAHICELVPAHFKLSDVAVLVRALGATTAFERAFDRAGIPFLVSGGRTFLEARETKDIMLLLAALVNPQDEVALYGVLRGPLVGMSDPALYQMGRDGWQSLFEERYGGLRKLAGFLPPDRLIAQVLDDTGYCGSLTLRARANVDKLLARIRREYRARPRPLAELLDDLEALRFTRSEAEAPPPNAAEAVRLMTIHAAKGLEFPVVFVSAVHRGMDRRHPIIAFSAQLGLGAKWRNPVSKKGLSDSVHAELKMERTAREEAEENRLLYVALTRAEDRLVVSYAERKRASPWQKLAEAAIPDAIAASTIPAITAMADLGEDPRNSEVLLDRPAPYGQYDSAVSATDVALFRACPRKYYLGRYLGLEPEPEAPGTGALELGMAVHRALAGENVDAPEAVELAARFHASDAGQRSAVADRVEQEFDFAVEMEGVIVSGQVDLWFEQGGELTIVDYKTDRDEASAQSYAIQLQLYALALARYVGRTADRAILYYLRPDRAVEVDVTRPALDNARASVAALRDAQDRIEFPIAPGPQCLRCAFYQKTCPAEL